MASCVAVIVEVPEYSLCQFGLANLKNYGYSYTMYMDYSALSEAVTINGYISIREASYKWGVSERRVNQYCSLGRIPGAERFGRSWAIPADAKKPGDPRKSQSKKQERGVM